MLTNILVAQTKTNLEIINSNLTIFDSSFNPDMRRLIDSVIFKHDNTIMYCDSAWHYFKDNRFEAFGKIHINNNDSLHLYGNHLDYIGEKDIAVIRGDIVLKDNKMTLKTDELIYNLNNNIASYYTGAEIVNNDNKLFSKIGYYYGDENLLKFKKSVNLLNPDYEIISDTLLFNTISEIAYFFGPTTITSDSNLIYCENGWYNTITDESRFSKNAFLQNNDQTLSGDSLIYKRKQAYGLALKNVQVVDTINSFIINGNRAELFERKDSSIITIDPLLILIMENDSLFLHSDTIVAFKKNKLEKVVKASTGVKFYSENLQGKCRELYYFNNDSNICMYHNPILWAQEYQMTADSIIMEMKNKGIDKLLLSDNAFIVSNPYPEFYNQIKGKKINGFFTNNEMKKIRVFGNGQVSYTIEDEYKKITGINTVTCSLMNIDVNNKKIKRISFQESPESVIFPTDELPLEWKRLKGFAWKGKEQIKNKEAIWK